MHFKSSDSLTFLLRHLSLPYFFIGWICCDNVDLSDFLTELRESPKADGKERIYTHGEKEILATADRMKNGLDVDVKTLAEMKDLSEYVGADFNSYFGDIYNE